MTQVYPGVEEVSNELDMSWLNFEIHGSRGGDVTEQQRPSNATQNGGTA